MISGFALAAFAGACCASVFPCRIPSRIARAFAEDCGSSLRTKTEAELPPRANDSSDCCSPRRICKFNSSPGFLLRSQNSARRGTFSPFHCLISSPAFSPARSAVEPGSTARTIHLPLESRSKEKPSCARTTSCLCSSNPAFARYLRIRNRFRARDIFLEEFLERFTRDRFDGQPNVETVAIGFPLRSEVFVHLAQDIVEGFCIVGAIANQDVERIAKYLPFCVIRNAEVGTVVVVVFVEPSIETRLLRALPFIRGARLQFVDLCGKIGVKILLRPESAAHLRVTAVGAGDAFSEPQRAGILFASVVDGFERSGANTFHVPEMEKLVSRNPREFARYRKC